MANEDELREARKKKAQALDTLGAGAFPSGFRVDEATEAKRRELFAIIADPDRLSMLPDEASLRDDADFYPLYGRVVAKRGPFVVIRTPLGDAQALVRPERLEGRGASELELLDLADHVAVEGPAIR